MITLFVLTTLEGWPAWMYYFIDADETGPMHNNYEFFFFYFMAFILVGSFFLLNLFTCVIALSYNMASKKAKN